MRKSSWVKRDPQTNKWPCCANFSPMRRGGENYAILSPISSLLMATRSTRITRGAKKRRPAFGSDASLASGIHFSLLHYAPRDLYWPCVSGSLVSDWWRWKYWARGNKKRWERHSIFPAYFEARASHCFFCRVRRPTACAPVLQSVHFININSRAVKWKVRKYRLLSWPQHVERTRFSPEWDSLTNIKIFYQ
jgi:hypothetical protein